MKLSSIFCGGTKILIAILITILLEQILDEFIDQRLKELLEMMNHLTDMKIAWDYLVSFHISMFYAKRLLDGVLNHLVFLCSR